MYVYPHGHKCGAPRVWGVWAFGVALQLRGKANYEKCFLKPKEELTYTKRGEAEEILLKEYNCVTLKIFKV